MSRPSARRFGPGIGLRLDREFHQLHSTVLNSARTGPQRPACQLIVIHAPVKMTLLISIFSDSALFDGDPCNNPASFEVGEGAGRSGGMIQSTSRGGVDAKSARCAHDLRALPVIGGTPSTIHSEFSLLFMPVASHTCICGAGIILLFRNIFPITPFFLRR